jgi:ribosomal protein L22
MADEKKPEKDQAKKPGRKPAAKRPAAKKPAAKSGGAASSGAAKSKTPAKKPAAKPKETATKGKGAAEATSKTADKKAAEASKAEKPAAKKAPARKASAKKTESKAKPSTKPAAKTAGGSSDRPVVNARARFVRLAPRKARLVADQVRGLPIDDALALLRFSSRGAARDIRKLIESAAANAEANHDLVADDLMVKDIHVDEGPTLRRYRPRALGRATRINKRTSHIAVALTPED